MFTRGHAKHPCTQHVYSQGFAVRPIRRYPWSRIHTRGVPLHICTSVSEHGIILSARAPMRLSQ
jgi:hypothetical protein